MSVFFDLGSDDLLPQIQSLADQVRSAVPQAWAVWPVPRGVCTHRLPHIGLMGYFPLSVDPVETLTKILVEVEHAVDRRTEDIVLAFAGNDIQLVPQTRINWPPSVRGSL